MKLISCFILSTIILTVSLVNQLSSAQSSNTLTKNKGKQTTGKDRHYSKSYGEVQFNKYRGQLPAKGAMIQCAFDCLSLSTCHCIGINIQTSECHFYGLEESPPYDSWKVPTSTNGSAGLSQLSNNSTNRDYLFFTRDIFAEESFDKVDVVAGRKMLTSWMLEQGALLDGKKASSKSKQKDAKTKANQSKLSKSKSGKKVGVKSFPFPWIQFEFKEPMYITEILLKATKDQSNELKNFHIRIGNESIAKFYESDQSSGGDNEPSWESAKPYDRNHICFEYPTATSHSAFLSNGIKKLNTFQKTIKCQPCGLMGRYLVIQSLNPCPNCKPLLLDEKPSSGKLSKAMTTTVSPSLSKVPLSFPIPISSIQVFGYPVGGKGRD